LSCVLPASFIFASCRRGAGVEVSITSCVYSLLSTTFQNKMSPLYAQYDQCALLTMERTPSHEMLSDRSLPAVPSRCINQAVTSRLKITTMEGRRQVNWRGQYKSRTWKGSSIAVFPILCVASPWGGAELRQGRRQKTRK
jgi:hypothetical protein